MRKQSLLLLLFSAVLSFSGFANKVVIKGMVNFPNGSPAVGRLIWVAADPSQPALCKVKDSSFTNPNGVFRDTLACEATIKKVVVAFRGCDGQIIEKVFEVPASGVVEASFVVCQPTECKPEFRWERADITGTTISFNSSSSVAGPGDEIIRRVWTFGDGTANEGNYVLVKKEYGHAGTYQVCLKTTTRNGCVKTFCQQVVVGNSTTACKAGIAFERLPATSTSAFSFRFNSSLTNLAQGDSIISHQWIFGDGNTLGGNVRNPLYTYQKPGNYEVCLVIKTKAGCESRSCISVVIEEYSCKPMVTFELLQVPTNTIGQGVRFNSKLNAPNTIDSIVSRTWTFGDGQTLGGNLANPVHVYEKTGEYKMCLLVKTKSGCISESCVVLKVEVVPKKCEAQFKWEAGRENIVVFGSGASMIGPNDSIVKRIWYYGDGKYETLTIGDAKHQYEKAGDYEVCLVIVTRNGCESKVCKKVMVGNAITAPKCQATFTIDNSRPGLAIFNSQSSFTSVPNDKIVSRRWDFGNGHFADGNKIITEMQYPFGGRYNVCLTIKTAAGCESRICKTVEVKQGEAPHDSSRVWLVKNYPNPVEKLMYAVIFSPKDNEQVEIAIIDVYGVVKSSFKTNVPKGYSTYNINTGALLPGPYLLRVRSAYGVQSRNFYKVN